MPDTLVHRYTYGNFAHLPTFGAEADFFLGVPARQRELVSLAKAQILEQQRATKAVIESNIAVKDSICRELRIQTEHLEQTIEAGAEAVVSAIGELGDRIAGELGEIRWELVQLRALSEQILAVLRRPRSTEARELLDQGIRNLVNDKIEQAEERFTLALRLDNTDYQILMNLSSVELRKGNAPQAIAFVHDALTLPLNLDAQAKSDALWHLARIYYAIRDYPKAFELAQQSATLLSASRRILQLGVYAILGGRLTDGLSLMARAVRQDPRLFSVVASIPDLEAHRSECLELLATLTSETLAELQDLSRKFGATVDHLGSLNTVPPGYVARLRARFEAIVQTMREGSYSELREALRMLSALHDIPDLLKKFDRSRLELSQSQQAELAASQQLTLVRNRGDFFRSPGCASLISGFGIIVVVSSIFQFFQLEAANHRSALMILSNVFFWATVGGSYFFFNTRHVRYKNLVKTLEDKHESQREATSQAQSIYEDTEQAVVAALDRAGC